MTSYSRDQIRDAVACPVCGAEIGTPCTYTGKGALKKMARGSNHHDRMHRAQLILNARDRDDDFEVIE